MRLFIRSVFVGAAESNYVPGLYEVADNPRQGVYTQFINQYRNTAHLEEALNSRLGTFPNPQPNLQHLTPEAAKQLDDMHKNLEAQACRGRFVLESLYGGKGWPKDKAHSPLVKHKSKAIQFEYSLFRVYGIQYGSDIFVVTSVNLKTTEKMNPADRKRAEEVLRILDEAGVNPSFFQNTLQPIEFDDED